jgi:hypothetical protein
VLGVILASCGDKSDQAESTSGPPNTPISAVATLSATAGGRLRLPDGAIVTIPARALSADATVKLVRETCEGVYRSHSFASCLYRVEIQGATPLGRFTIQLPQSRKSPAPCVTESNSDGFRCLADTHAKEQTFTATASKSGQFVVLASANTGTDGRGTDIPFDACGGNAVGNWTLIRGAGTAEQLAGYGSSGATNPFAACSEYDYQVDHPTRMSGSLTFSDDGTWEQKQSIEIKRHELITDDCLSAVGEPCAAECVHADGICDCLWKDFQGDGGGGGAWTQAAGGTLTFDASSPVPYCVSDNTLTIELPSASGPYLMIYGR